MTSLSVLLVDDNPDDRILVSRQLQQEFDTVEITEASSEKQLQQLLGKQTFHLIITDYQLRWSTGINVLRLVKQKEPNCPVIMFTGTGNEEVAVEAMKLGLDDYVIKSPKHYQRLAKSARSIWERIQSEKALQEAHLRYRRLFESVPVGLYRLLPNGSVIEANATLVQMLGYSDVEDLLTHEENLIQRHIDLESYQAWKSQMAQKGVVERLETPLCCLNGRLIWVRHHAQSVTDEEGNLLYYEGAIADISDRKRIEEERTALLEQEKEARAAAEAANRLKDEFLATLSHELRTPLNAMLGWVQLMRSGRVRRERVNHALEIIERNARAQAQLIEDLLDVSRIIRGKMQLKLRTINIQTVIENALETVRPAAQAKSIRIESVCNSNIRPIQGDPDRLQQVIWNLLVNGVKFTPSGGKVTISVQQHPDAIEIQVSDTGKGIQPQYLPYIFERFRQVDGSSTRAFGGLGLGLAIVRHLVELHGGTVSAHSPGEGKGTIFTVQLPCQMQNPKIIIPSDSPISENLPVLTDVHILIVEDEPDTREMITYMLEQCGAIVSPAATVQDAVALFEVQHPDILVSDIAMPDADGYELMEILRSRQGSDGKAPLKAIALTAYASEEHRQKALNAGFSLHLAKPLDL
ncbi:MAG: response regulator, partial [Cyanobacteriota bacterium]